MKEDVTKIVGRNPVREAIRSGRNINKIYVANGETDYTLSQIIKLAKEHDIFVQRTDRRKLDLMSGNASHQGVVAICSAVRFATVEDILELAREREEKPFIVMLDGITDPHNAGAIIRSAYCAGAHGVIFAERRSAGIGEGVFKASAGSIEYIKIAQVTNLAQTLDALKQIGLFAVACDMDGTTYYDIDYDMPLVIIVGAEGKGVSRLIREKSDFVATIPMKASFDSLNASVAAGIVMFEALRQRG